MSSENNPEVIIAKYKQMTSECQQIAGKVQELNIEKDEHRLVLDTLGKLNGDRKAHRLVGGVLVERTVEEVLPDVKKNYEMVRTLT
jgi:prefoldin subunit 2